MCYHSGQMKTNNKVKIKTKHNFPNDSTTQLDLDIDIQLMFHKNVQFYLLKSTKRETYFAEIKKVTYLLWNK